MEFQPVWAALGEVFPVSHYSSAWAAHTSTVTFWLAWGRCWIIVVWIGSRCGVIGPLSAYCNAHGEL